MPIKLRQHMLTLAYPILNHYLIFLLEIKICPNFLSLQKDIYQKTCENFIK